MKKQNVLNLIKYHVERNENGFRNEAISIARYFDSIGDDQLAEYIMGLIAESNLYAPQGSDYESDFLKTIDTRGADPLYLPTEISEDVKGIINAVNHNVGITKFHSIFIDIFYPLKALEKIKRQPLKNQRLFYLQY